MVQFVGDEEDEAVLLQQLVDAEVMVHGLPVNPEAWSPYLCR